jgi:hypothetical protein
LTIDDRREVGVMGAQNTPVRGALLAGGQERPASPPASELPARGARLPGRPPAASIVAQEPAAEGPPGRSATDIRTATGSWVESTAPHLDVAWPAWALPQLTAGIAVADRTPAGGSVAARLYRDWFNPPLPELDALPPFRYAMPLAGVYRAAHAGTGRRLSRDGVAVLDRHDVVGRDGWWRTWGSAWTPPRERRRGVRLVLSPRPDRLGVVVRTVTAALLDTDLPWSLACATSPRRVCRTGAVVLDVPCETALPAGLVPALSPALLPQRPPLCLPVGRGAALAGHPSNGMTFGEHRCHLIALALRRGAGARRLSAIAEVFDAHGIDPAAPYRCAS